MYERANAKGKAVGRKWQCGQEGCWLRREIPEAALRSDIEQRSERGERERFAKTWGKNHTGTGTSRCTSPEMKTSLEKRQGPVWLSAGQGVVERTQKSEHVGTHRPP